MKKIILALGCSVLLLSVRAQNAAFNGTWLGTVNVGIELRLVFHIGPDGKGGVKSTVDSPDQAAYGMKCDTTILDGNKVSIQMSMVRASFSGQLVNDTTIEGNFKQTTEIPVVLKKTEIVPQLKRPQEPKPPFPYKSEDVEYDNVDRSLHYGATLTLPAGNGPFPAAVLITGSGQQTRDEELMGHKTFLVLADALTRNGFAVLRVDDRGIGKSTGIFGNATSADFAQDVNTSVNYLLYRVEINKKKVGLIGHSEGGMIAPIVASSRKDIAFVVLLAAPGIRIDSLMGEQNAGILLSSGVSQKAVDAYLPVYKNITQLMLNAPDSAAAVQSATAYLDNWLLTADTAVVKELGLKNSGARSAMASAMTQSFSRQWFKYFLAFDPQPYLRKMTGKVLALNGDKDIQVKASSNLAGIETALKKSKVKSYTIKAMPGLNHLFQSCTKCSITEYGQLEETFSPAALQEINAWLSKEIK